MDGINSNKTSLPANDNGENQKQDSENKSEQNDEKAALKGNYRPSTKKPGVRQSDKQVNNDDEREGAEDDSREENDALPEKSGL